jgi:poly-gamma-glutamate synthase PgsB/CapB
MLIKMMLAVTSVIAMLVYLGWWESRWHRQNVQAVPLRINVNGSRGKSTVTRLVFAMLCEAGYQAVGKTTGSAARMLYWFTDTERPIRRSVLGANISEQKRVVAEAAAWNAQALVCECMALKPAYQKVFQETLLQANVTVLTNVLADHLDVMGPTLDDVARVFADSIPYGGKLVIAPGPYAGYFSDIALERGTTVHIADVAAVTDESLRPFSYVLFAENVALALAVADALQIDRAVAWRGLMRATPDPGALRFKKIALGEGTHELVFFNGFAANDPQSTLAVWDKIVALGYSAEQPLIVMNARADRTDRTAQFVREVFPFLPAYALLAIGQRTDLISEAIADGRLQPTTYIDLEDAGPERMIERISEWCAAREQSGARGKPVVLGVGNIHGAAMSLLRVWMPEVFVDGGDHNDAH